MIDAKLAPIDLPYIAGKSTLISDFGRMGYYDS